MKFALFGEDPAALEVAEAVSVSTAHELALVCEVAGSPIAQFTGLRDTVEWESLLHHPQVDAVIVARHPDLDLHAERLRKLFQAAMPMIVVHPACESIVCYELDMIRKDTGGIVYAHCPGQAHQGFRALREIVADDASPLGPIQQVSFDRSLHDQHRSEVTMQLARDVQLIRQMVGEVTSVSAISATRDAENYANLNVNLTTASGTLVRWTAGPVDRQPEGRLVVTGSTGKAVLLMPTDQSPWRMECTGRKPAEFAGDGEPQQVLEQFTSLVQSGKQADSWTDACRSGEVADTVAHSLRRGRTIDLYGEVPSEESTFKGMMAAGGCAMLMLSFVAVLLASVAEAIGLAGWIDRIIDGTGIGLLSFARSEYWLGWLLALLLVFLLLQTLKLVFARRGQNENPVSDRAK